MEEVSSENYKISQQLKTLVQLGDEAEDYFKRIFDKSLGFEEVFEKTKDEKDKIFVTQGQFEKNLLTTIQDNQTNFEHQIFERRKLVEKNRDQFEKNMSDYKYDLGNRLYEISDQEKTKHQEHIDTLNDSDKKFRNNDMKHKEVSQLITVNLGTTQESRREVEETFGRVLFVQSRNSHDSISNLLHDTSDKVIMCMFIFSFLFLRVLPLLHMKSVKLFNNTCFFKRYTRVSPLH